MPVNGCPSSSTPSSVSAATAPGISPSPQALSIGARARFDHRDVEAGPRGVEGGGQPDRARRPRPARSRTGGARAGSVAQRGVLHPDPHGEQGAR